MGSPIRPQRPQNVYSLRDFFVLTWESNMGLSWVFHKWGIPKSWHGWWWEHLLVGVTSDSQDFIGLSINQKCPIVGWFIMENPNLKWMIWGYPGKLTVCYGKSIFFRGEWTIIINGHFHSYVKVPEGSPWNRHRDITWSVLVISWLGIQH